MTEQLTANAALSRIIRAVAGETGMGCEAARYPRNCSDPIGISTRKTPGYGDRVPRVEVVAQRENARADIASYYDISRHVQSRDMNTTVGVACGPQQEMQ